MFLMQESHVEWRVLSNLLCNANNFVLLKKKNKKNLENKDFASITEIFRLLFLGSKNCSDLYHSEIMNNSLLSVWFKTTNCKIPHLHFWDFLRQLVTKNMRKTGIWAISCFYFLCPLNNVGKQRAKLASSTLWIRNIVYGERGTSNYDFKDSHNILSMIVWNLEKKNKRSDFIYAILTIFCFNVLDYIGLHSIMNIMTEKAITIWYMWEKCYYKHTLTDFVVWLSC